MKRFIQLTIRFLFVTAVLMFGGILPSFSADLQVFSNGRLINDPANDGDSFLVEANGKSFHVRLYFVDCPETLIAFTGDAQRVREQTRYFGLSDAKRTIHSGDVVISSAPNGLHVRSVPCDCPPFLVIVSSCFSS